VTSDSIRVQLVDIYQNKVDVLDEMDQVESQIQQETALWDLIATEIDWENIEQARPFNYANFLKNNEFSARLKALKVYSMLAFNRRKAILGDIKKVRLNVGHEIDRLSGVK
jgi:hypothetical protein